MESPTFSVIRKMQWGEACAKPIWAVVKARDPPAKVEVVHWAINSEKWEQSCVTWRHSACLMSLPPKTEPAIPERQTAITSFPLVKHTSHFTQELQLG